MLALLSGKEIRMTHTHQLADERYALLKSLLFAIVAGSVVGVIDLWVFEPSLKLFLAGQAAGITFFVVYFLLGYLLNVKQGIRHIPLVTISGALAGFMWWVAADSVMSLWLAILIGAGFSNLVMWIETGFKPEND
jgi:hypothetical protein